jgi:hypothetical protein
LQDFSIEAKFANGDSIEKNTEIEWRIPAAATMISPDGWKLSEDKEYYFKKIITVEKAASV